MDSEVFPIVLKRIRSERKVSQEKLAELSGLDRTYISLLERGLRQPTLGTIFKISKSLEILPSEMIKQIEEFNANS